MSRDPGLLVAEMRQVCETLLAYSAEHRIETFFQDGRTYQAALWNLLILGEAVKSLPGEWRDQHPAIDWRKIGGLRDVLAHHYFGLDQATLWDVLRTKIPELLAYLKQLP